MLLLRGGLNEEEQKGTELDFRTIKRLHVAMDLYEVLAWVEKKNKTRKEYLGHVLDCPSWTRVQSNGNYQEYTTSNAHLIRRHTLLRWVTWVVKSNQINGVLVHPEQV